MNIFKKIILLILLILPFNAYGDNKIAYVDLDFILTNINAGKVVFEKLKKKKKIKKKIFSDK